MVTKLPVLDTTQYQVSDDMWSQLVSEIQAVRKRIANGDELMPADVKQVRQLASIVQSYGVTYRKAITKAADGYKARLNQELAQVGYGEIEQYIAKKKKEQTDAVNKRISDKLNHFNSIVNEQLEKTQHLKVSTLGNFVGNQLLSRYPKISSGAVSNDVKNWTPIEKSVTETILKAEEQFLNYPELSTFPSTSNGMRTLGNFIRTGDEKYLSQLPNSLKLDEPLRRDMKIKSVTKTASDTTQQVEYVMNSNVDDQTKLERIQQLLNAYRANQY